MSNLNPYIIKNQIKTNLKYDFKLTIFTISLIIKFKGNNYFQFKGFHQAKAGRVSRSAFFVLKLYTFLIEVLQVIHNLYTDVDNFFLLNFYLKECFT